MADFWSNLRASMLRDSLNGYDDNYVGDSKEVRKAKDHLRQSMYSKKKAREELTHAYANRLTDYKNSWINQLFETDDYKNDGLKSIVKSGKMFDDNGNLEDIDYDYYATVPQGTLKRVFGDGAEDVSRVISDRQKVSEGKFDDIDYDYYASAPNRMIDVVFGDYADNVRNKFNREGK